MNKPFLGVMLLKSTFFKCANTQNYWENRDSTDVRKYCCVHQKGNNFFKEPLFPYHNVK
uniref:Uncharacterized protein n=1 Tax=Anguilla anguilla TaxID=7936 RepID=A0A0E9SXK6_ANGAN